MFERLLHLDCIFMKLAPISVGVFRKLPTFLKHKRYSLLNIKSPPNDNHCLLYAICGSIFHQTTSQKNLHRYKKYLKFLKSIQYQGVTFPAGKKDLAKIERLNKRLSICVFMCLSQNPKNIRLFPWYVTDKQQYGDESGGLIKIDLLVLPRMKMTKIITTSL